MADVRTPTKPFGPMSSWPLRLLTTVAQFHVHPLEPVGHTKTLDSSNHHNHLLPYEVWRTDTWTISTCLVQRACIELQRSIALMLVQGPTFQ